MAYILNKYLNPKKKLFLALQDSIRGIGPALAKQLCARIGVSPSVLVQDLSPKRFRILIQLVDQVDRVKPLETSLKRRTRQNIKRLIDTKTYRGYRHIFNLPCHGQRTHQNAQTRKRMNWRAF